MSNTKLKALMEEKKVTARKLAKLTGSVHSTVWRHITGKSKLSFDDAILYARALGVSISDLVG